MDGVFAAYTSDEESLTLTERERIHDYLGPYVSVIAQQARMDQSPGLKMSISGNPPDLLGHEVDLGEDQQELLRKLSAIPADVVRCFYPFFGAKLGRQHVRWLFEAGSKPIDLRGADLSHRNLRGLAMPGLRGGLAQDEWFIAVNEQLAQALKSASYADDLPANLMDLYYAASMNVQRSLLEDADLTGAILNYVNFSGSFLHGACLRGCELLGSNLSDAKLNGADLTVSLLMNADLSRAEAQDALFARAHLDGAVLEKADLSRAHFEQCSLQQARLGGARLTGAFLDHSTDLQSVNLGDDRVGYVFLSDVHWGDANISTVEWPALRMTGEEFLLRKLRKLRGL